MSSEPCPICEDKALVRRTTCKNFYFRGQVLSIDDYEFFLCLSCQVSFIDEEFHKRIGLQQKLESFRDEVKKESG